MRFLFGNAINGVGWRFSVKKLLYVVASLNAIVVPNILFSVGIIDGDQWVRFFEYFSLGALGLYGVGEWVDSKAEFQRSFSTKKILFILTSANALIVPNLLLIVHQVNEVGGLTGAQWLDFYMYFSLEALAVYGGVKWIQVKTHKNQEES